MYVLHRGQRGHGDRYPKSLSGIDFSVPGVLKVVPGPRSDRGQRFDSQGGPAAPASSRWPPAADHRPAHPLAGPQQLGQRAGDQPGWPLAACWPGAADRPAHCRPRRLRAAGQHWRATHQRITWQACSSTRCSRSGSGPVIDQAGHRQCAGQAQQIGRHQAPAAPASSCWPALAGHRPAHRLAGLQQHQVQQLRQRAGDQPGRPPATRWPGQQIGQHLAPVAPASSWWTAGRPPASALPDRPAAAPGAAARAAFR